jgi:CheY-like chemotaxis protein
MTPTGGPQPAPILLVEDSTADIELTRIAFEDGGVVNDLVVVQDGTDALTYLRGESPYVDAPRPALILLDLHLPRMDGREVIEAMGADPELAAIAVVALADPHDADLAAIHDRCLGVMPKPVDVERLAELVRSDDGFEAASPGGGSLAIIPR